MSFLEKLFKGGVEGPEKPSEARSPDLGRRGDATEPKVRWEDVPGTLDLGWYYGENKKEFQMAKVAKENSESLRADQINRYGDEVLKVYEINY